MCVNGNNTVSLFKKKIRMFNKKEKKRKEKKGGLERLNEGRRIVNEIIEKSILFVLCYVVINRDYIVLSEENE